MFEEPTVLDLYSKSWLWFYNSDTPNKILHPKLKITGDGSTIMHYYVWWGSFAGAASYSLRGTGGIGLSWSWVGLRRRGCLSIGSGGANRGRHKPVVECVQPVQVRNSGYVRYDRVWKDRPALSSFTACSVMPSCQPATRLINNSSSAWATARRPRRAPTSRYVLGYLSPCPNAATAHTWFMADRWRLATNVLGGWDSRWAFLGPVGLSHLLAVWGILVRPWRRAFCHRRSNILLSTSKAYIR
jgi:hypothetical protein